MKCFLQRQHQQRCCQPKRHRRKNCRLNPPRWKKLSTEPSLAEVLDEAGFVLETSSGEPVSLASQAVLDSVNNSDPYLWSGGIKYSYKFTGACTEGLNVTCFESVNPIQSAIDDIETGTFIPTDGTLYFDAGSTYDVDSIVIDTVPGLKKLMGATNPTTGEPTVTINLVDYFEIYNQSGFSISGFNITGNAPLYYGTLEIGGNTGTLTLTDLVVRNLNADGSAIDIYDQSGAVILQNVDASDNPGGGVFIDSYSPSITPVTIKNSSIQNNGGNSWVNGLYINTRGAVLLEGVTVSGNGDTNSDYSCGIYR